MPISAEVKFLFICVVVILALIIGAKLWQSVFERSSTITTTTFIENRIEIPAKQESKPSIDVQRPDTIKIIETMECDSLRDLMRAKMQIATQSFKDSLAAHDSLGSSFSVVSIDSLRFDPFKRIFDRSIHYRDAIFKAAHVKTVETKTTIDLLITALAFIAGLVIALLIN